MQLGSILAELQHTPKEDEAIAVRIETCPGGIAVIVPTALAAQVGLQSGGSAEVELRDGQLVIRPTKPATLDELLSQITPENVHSEWATGPAVGAELL